ncbi:FecR family protein [Aquimarina mytili]|uniref:FecR family protein n=1 Tax=Aquimarina mytili TaxID=874423 RepID=A0A936ZVP6_9FLAO|nr:FecR family protein [Aquimarina mytili]MBL0685177.1 FecR family protein [Aquimarina mytili]
MKKKDLITKWLDHEQLTREELKAFKNLDAYDSYEKISSNAKSFKAPKYNIEENLQDLKVSLTQEQRSIDTTKKFPINFLIRIAAIFILGIGTYFMAFYNSDTITNTIAGQKTSIELPDQSSVQLNALSSIRYKEKNWEDNRKIELEGEAYFKVAKGKTFDVHTSSGIISVLGTEFNVKQREHYFEVVCYEGLVSVTYNKNTIKLPAGSVFKVQNNNIVNTTTSLVKPDWINNLSSFHSTPYSYILKEFERQYNVTIIAKNIDQDKLFTGNFVHSNIETALQSITIPMRLKYKIDNNNITLYKE